MLHPKLSTTYVAINNISDESQMKVITVSGRLMHVEVYFDYLENKFKLGGVT